MAGFYPVDVDITVSEDGASDRTYSYGVLFHAHLFYDLCYELVHDAVAASRAVVHGSVVHQRRSAVDFILGYYEFFLCHDCVAFLKLRWGYIMNPPLCVITSSNIP